MIADIVQEVKSGVVHIVHIVEGKRVSSGTGFMVNGYLVTNFHVIYSSPKNSNIILKILDSDSNDLSNAIKLNREDLMQKTITASDEKNNDYIVLNIPELKNINLYNFGLSSHHHKRIGDQILFLGYHFDNFNLACHTGIISSIYKKNNIDIIQIDASVNNSNSGSPLIDPITSNVIGIITRKESALTPKFNQLRSLTRNTIERLYNSKTYINAVEPIQEIRSNNQQILELYNQIERSANVGIGYAFSVEILQDENCFYNEE